MSAKSRVVEQITKILDENASTTVSIIVQAPSPELDAALSAVAKRPVSIDRGGLPISASSRRTSRATDANGSRVTLLSRKTRNEALVKQLVNSPLVQHSRLARKSDRQGKPTSLWLAGAAVMTMHRDDIAKIPTEMPEAVAVFPNRRISVPPRIQSASVPIEIESRTQYTWGLDKSGALACWGAFNARGAGVRVAVLDTGIDANHPDLKGKVAAFAEFDRNEKIVNQGIANAYDDDGHGTHVSGTIVGGKESGRWIGMAPDAKIIAAKVLKNGVGSDAQIIAGMTWALQQGAHVLNLSLGGWTAGIDVVDTYTSIILQAHDLGVPVVAAIGNEGAGTSGSPGTDYFSLGVGATDVFDRAAGFSGGRTHIIQKSDAFSPKDLPVIFIKPDLVAPGIDVYSARKGGKWEYMNGTSMATPHVSGAIALLLSGIGKRGLDAQDLRAINGVERVELLSRLITGSAFPLGEAGQNSRFGYGRLDIAASYSNALNLKYLS